MQIEVIALENEGFLFKFEDKHTGDWVLEGGPWLIERKPLLLKQWVSGFVVERLPMKRISL